MTDTLAEFATKKLAELQGQRLRRVLTTTERVGGVEVVRAGRTFISFSCNDYLGLSHHPLVRAAALRALEAYGVGAGASRLVTGNASAYANLEGRLAMLKGTEAACVFGSGYLANAGTIPSVVGSDDIVLVDQLAHACIWAGCKLSGAKTVAFRHNDVGDLAYELSKVRASHPRALVATDGVFSMDGDIAPLDEISHVCVNFGAWLLVDDAHGFGVLGDGAGVAALFPSAQVDLAMGTLSKALGGYGAYVCGRQPVIDLLKTRARTLVYTTGLPPATVAAAIAALDVVAAEPDRVARPVMLARAFTNCMGLPPAQSAIVPIILGSAERALAAAADLETKGLLAVAIRPPTVPLGAARLRLAFSAAHTEEHVEALGHALRPWLL